MYLTSRYTGGKRQRQKKLAKDEHKVKQIMNSYNVNPFFLICPVIMQITLAQPVKSIHHKVVIMNLETGI